jgi:hypothetical protein
MKIAFTAADVRQLLDLPNRQAVEDLIASRVLSVSAYTRRGQPLFDAEAVRRAAERVLREGEEAPPA